MNAMKKDLTHRTPISLRIYLHVVPGVTLEPGVSGGCRDQAKLATRGPEVAVDVWRVDVAVDAQLAKRWRLLDHVEGEPARFHHGQDGNAVAPEPLAAVVLLFP